MENNFEMEQCSTDVVNKCMSSKISDVKTVHKHNATNKKEKFKDSDLNNDIDKKEKLLLSKNRCLLLAEELTEDEPWKIEEESDYEADLDLDASLSCKVLILDTEKKILVPYRKSKNSSIAILKPFPNENKLKELKSVGEANLPTSKEIKPLSFTQFLEMGKTPDIVEKDLEISSKVPKKKIKHNDEITMNLNQNINNDFDSTKKKLNPVSFLPFLGIEPLTTNVSAPSFSKNCCKPYSKDLYSPSSSDNLYGPSCSKDLYNLLSSKDLPDLSNLTNSSVRCECECDSLHSVDKLPVSVGIDNNFIVTPEEKVEVEVLQEFYNKSYLNQMSAQTKSVNENEINQGVTVIAIDKSDIINDLLKNELNKSSEDSNSSSESNGSFQEDPDIVNFDIMYNIDLNEHLKQMNLLVEKISKTPNDPSLLDECMQLIQIPQVESYKKTFTAEERQNFAEGNSEWEYEIDKEDWNKIMVKRAVVFTAHAGFSIANEESLYVLADVAIDYIKKLALIMKKNFDIKARSSCPVRIDAVNNSLLEIGVTGGVGELLNHYENDVYGKRDRLMKKCQHLQKVIDQFIERLFLDPKIKNKYNKDNSEEENSCVKVMKKDETVFQQENITVGETFKTEYQSMVEEMELDSLSSPEKTEFTNVEIEQQIEPMYIDNTNNDCKIDNDSNNFKKMKTDFEDSIISINDKKNNFNKNHAGSLTVDKSDIELLTPLEITLARLMNETLEDPSSFDLDEQKINVFSSKNFFSCDQNVISYNHLAAKQPSRTIPPDVDLLTPLEITLARFKGETLNTSDECSSFTDSKEQKINVFPPKKSFDCD